MIDWLAGGSQSLLNAALVFGLLRLWGYTRSSREYPVDPAEIVEARKAGITRTNAMEVWRTNVPEHFHQPLLQTQMQQETVHQYKPACWVKGYCQRLSISCQNQHNALRKLVVQEIRSQIEKILPPQRAKEYLVSGDVAVLFRSSSSASSDGPGSGSGSSASRSESDPSPKPEELMKVYLLAKMSLKPIRGVLVAMKTKQVSTPDSESMVAYLDVDDRTGCFVFKSSWDLVGELLALQSTSSNSVIYVNVLEHEPVFLS